jgi:hypothetical protein
MRQILTFLVTILFSEEEPDTLRGRARHVQSDAEVTFKNAIELTQWVQGVSRRQPELSRLDSGAHMPES